MHELGLMHNLLQLIEEQAAANKLAKITKIKLLVGRANGALPDAMQFAFEALSPGTLCENAVLEIEQTPVILECQSCFRCFEAEEIWSHCPDCTSFKTKIIDGRQLMVEYIEGENGEVDNDG